MLLPSLLIIFLGVVFAAVMMAINWYVWGRTWAGDIRQPSQVTPFAGKALIEQALARLIATNQAVFPQITITRDRRSEHTASSFEPADGGFRHVA